MKICISCGSINGCDKPFCIHCKNGDLRTITRMNISLGKFDGTFELSDEEEKVLEKLRGYDVLDENDRK